MLGTQLVLDGVRIPYLEAALRQRARGFPIPVLYNGEALPRPHALDSGRRFEGTAIGDVYLHGAMRHMDRWGALACYLQGLPVHATACEDGERTTLVHLDSRRFLARLPDRDTLIDAPEAIDQVEKEVARLAQERLRRLKAELPAEQFVLGFACLGRWKALSLLNDVPYVPAEVLSRIEDYPMIPRWDGVGMGPRPTASPCHERPSMPARCGSLASMASTRRRPVRRCGGSSPGAWGTRSSIPARSMPATGCTLT